MISLEGYNPFYKLPFITICDECSHTSRDFQGFWTLSPYSRVTVLNLWLVTLYGLAPITINRPIGGKNVNSMAKNGTKSLPDWPIPIGAGQISTVFCPELNKNARDAPITRGFRGSLRLLSVRSRPLPLTDDNRAGKHF